MHPKALRSIQHAARRHRQAATAQPQPSTERMPHVTSMDIAMVGTRGVPARYGGFETAVEEVGRRLAAAGHRVVVYCRTTKDDEAAAPETYLGMELVHLPAARKRSLE